MMDMDGPLDFEMEDPLASSPVVKNKRKKVIGLDDLLTDFYKEKSKCIDKKNKRAKAPKTYNSDEDDNGKEALLSKYVRNCQNQMEEMGGEEDICEWGLTVFGNQKPPAPLVFPELQSCSLVQSFINNEVNSLVDLTAEQGSTFLEGLLVNGWLKKLVLRCGHVEKSVATWTFNLLLYSSTEALRASACDFWCAIISCENEVNARATEIDWFPSYSDLKGALETYGFLFNCSSNEESLHTDCGEGGPPQNIRAWIKFIAACCQIRSKRSIFLTSEAEWLVEVLIYLLLDRQLQGLSILLHECMESVIGYFKDEEWGSSREKIAKSLASRIPRDLNCLRAVECISGTSSCSKQLRSEVAYQMLVVCFDNKVADEEILSLLMATNMKEKDTDLFKVYIDLVLAEHWLLSSSVLKQKPVMNEMWAVFLRNCSCQISSTDLRSYASKVRNKASYLLQASDNKSL